VRASSTARSRIDAGYSRHASYTTVKSPFPSPEPCVVVVLPLRIPGSCPAREPRVRAMPFRFPHPGAAYKSSDPQIELYGAFPPCDGEAAHSRADRQEMAGRHSGGRLPLDSSTPHGAASGSRRCLSPAPSTRPPVAEPRLQATPPGRRGRSQTERHRSLGGSPQ
jgi:hypothetical protein